MNESEQIAAKADNVDIREQLFNGGECGVVGTVSTGVNQVTSIRGILLDIDPQLFAEGWAVADPDAPPNEFYKLYVAEWLEHHPVLKKAEVRCSGKGLHVLLMLDKPIQLKSELDQRRWAAQVQVIQACLPSDPQQPTINAMTRKLGSVNSKNNAEVSLLRKGVGITEEELQGLAEEMASAPFKTIAHILHGDADFDPCPVCGEERMKAGEQVGKCYRCQNITVDKLLRTVLRAKKPGHKEVKHAKQNQ